MKEEEGSQNPNNLPVIPPPSNNDNHGAPPTAAASLRALTASVERLSGHVEILSSQIATLSSSIVTMTANMDKMSATMEKTTDNLWTLNATIDKVHGSLDKMLKTVQEPGRIGTVQGNGNGQPQLTQQQQATQQQKARQASQLRTRQQQYAQQQLSQQQLSQQQFAQQQFAQQQFAQQQRAPMNFAAEPLQQPSIHTQQPQGFATTPTFDFWNGTQIATAFGQQNQNTAFGDGLAGIAPMRSHARHVSGPLPFPLMTQDQTGAAGTDDVFNGFAHPQIFGMPEDVAKKRRREDY
ncbi:hypothetical protein QC762_100058 [Podospora pseudocomata]|uniref:Uncharacterized protein n=1 Tax=Podospora pseudocomata TaxID=2093779 RepID=A0ABR0GRF9_9PEZI|nr:hypothetical protein QC762_100058 [Podospora pseudocomata]